MNRALVVGIGDYGRLGRPLPGCANDRTGWRDLLVPTLNVSGSNLRVRADAQATRDVLLEDLLWLLSDVSAGDQRVFFFAGHGARLRRHNAQSGAVETVLNETLVAYPGASDDYETFMLFDSDLAALIDQSAFPASARLTLIIDACHAAGAAMPFEDAPVARCLELDAVARALEWELAVPVVRKFGSLQGVQVSRVFVAAARPEQSAWDARMADGQRHGVFSYHALRAISGQPTISFERLITTITPPIASNFPQNPMLLGDSSRFSGFIFN